MKQANRSSRGFTLVELLVAVALIAFIMALAAAAADLAAAASQAQQFPRLKPSADRLVEILGPLDATLRRAEAIVLASLDTEALPPADEVADIVGALNNYKTLLEAALEDLPEADGHDQAEHTALLNLKKALVEAITDLKQLLAQLQRLQEIMNHFP